MERNNKPSTSEIDQKIAFAKLVSICLLIVLILSVLATLYFFYELKKAKNEIELTNKQLIEKNNTIAERHPI